MSSRSKLIAAKVMLKRFVLRVLIALLLAVSPIVFPALLLWMDGRVSWPDLAELYGGMFRVFARGFL